MPSSFVGVAGNGFEPVQTGLGCVLEFSCYKCFISLRRSILFGSTAHALHSRGAQSESCCQVSTALDDFDINGVAMPERLRIVSFLSPRSAVQSRTYVQDGRGQTFGKRATLTKLLEAPIGPQLFQGILYLNIPEAADFLHKFTENRTERVRNLSLPFKLDLTESNPSTECHDRCRHVQ